MLFSVAHTTSEKCASVPFERIRKAILGNSYGLSLALVGEKRARSINIKTRNKSYIPNVLSFSLSKTEGEIVLTPAIAKREARALGCSFKERVSFLFIHGCLHLKGYTHGRNMERLEKRHMRSLGF